MYVSGIAHRLVLKNFSNCGGSFHLTQMNECFTPAFHLRTGLDASYMMLLFINTM